MYKILVLLAFSVYGLFAKEYPLERTIDIKVQNNTTTILEMPFIIKDKTFDKFRRTVDEKREPTINDVEVPTLKKEIREIDGKKVIVSKKEDSVPPVSGGTPMVVNVSSSGNIVELKPNQEGITKIVLWGYEHYPVMINIEVVNTMIEKNDYYKFIDYKAPKDEVVKFEAQKHETIIRKLVKSAYLNETPNGYKKTIVNEIEENEKYKMILNQVYLGNKYGLKAYDFINISGSDLILKNRMFYKEGSVYAVSIEKLANKNKEIILKPKELTRIFVVFKLKES